jgi:hypothetical protein
MECKVSGLQSSSTEGTFKDLVYSELVGEKQAQL